MFKIHPLLRRASLFALLVLGFIAFNAGGARAQSVAGGTTISNRVAVQYTEPGGANVQTVSNTVTVTVVNVTGLAITPDNGSAPGVNAGALAVQRTFTITNTGNITEAIVFGSAGASLIKTGPYTVTAAFVDVNGDGTFNAGDVDILTSTGPLSLALGASATVVVRGDVSPSAAVGNVITLQLGDAATGAPSFDNQPADLSPASVKTQGSTGVNGNLEARGNLSFTVTAAGAVQIGPNGQPGAVGPDGTTNTDYTNRTLTAGVNVPSGGVTTAGGAITFINTIRNLGVAADNITVTAPTFPTGFQVEVRTGAAAFVRIDGGGSQVFNVPATSNLNIDVRITAPAGITVLQGFSTTLRAASGITPQNTNDTIDSLFSGFIRADKSVVVTNGTGVGAANAAVPGAVIEYTITYTNVTASSGTNNANLTATNVVLTEDGNAAPNNWGSTTNQVVGSASDTSAGSTIVGDAAGSSLLTVTIPSLAPGASGTFKFSRTIR